jgi:lysophospholipase L1-like esterase
LTRHILTLAALIAGLPAARGEDGTVIASMDPMRFQAPKEKGRAEPVAGKVGGAIRFQFDNDARGVFFTSNIHGAPEWDRAQGFSFWVKGEGHDGFGGLEFIYDEDYAVRYDLCFPIKGREWTKVTVAWADLIPVLPGPRAKPLGSPGGNSPSKLSGLWIGRWWYWGNYPALDFALDEIRLEPTVHRDANEYRPDGPPLARTLARLKSGKPITVVTMGDSLTDKRHWANREVAWVDLLKGQGEKKFNSNFAIINPAIGGTQLRQNLILIPTWLAKAPEPDLVTIFFGGNDWDAGMRREEFVATVEDAIDRVRRTTKGKADVLVLTANPSSQRWGGLAQLAEACRLAARDRNAGLADTERAFQSAGRDDHDRLFVRDRVHLSRAGHEVVAETVLKAIDASTKGQLP